MCPRQGTFFSCLAKKRRQKKATPLPATPARSAGATCGAWCWRGLARTRACGAQTIASPDPPSPALLGAARRGLKPARAIAALGRVWGAECSDGPNRSPPFHLAAPRSTGRGVACVPQDTHASLSSSPGLSERSASARSEFHGALRDRAPQVARSEAQGRRLWGAFLLGTFLWRSKEKYLARRGETRPPPLAQAPHPVPAAVHRLHCSDGSSGRCTCQVSEGCKKQAK
jgi:hypothetical protein